MRVRSLHARVFLGKSPDEALIPGCLVFGNRNLQGTQVLARMNALLDGARLLGLKKPAGPSLDVSGDGRSCSLIDLSQDLFDVTQHHKMSVTLLVRWNAQP